jgi:hypothetical protein
MSDDSSYEVGYGKTPEHTRFRKNDGRPRGKRPRGSKNTKTLIRKAHAKTVRVKDKDGRVKRRSRLEHMVEVDANEAFTDARTRWRNIETAMSLDAEDEARAAMRAHDALVAEDELIINRYLDSLADPPPPPPPQSVSPEPQKED